jgi:hypothetical protein
MNSSVAGDWLVSIRNKMPIVSQEGHSRVFEISRNWR